MQRIRGWLPTAFAILTLAISVFALYQSSQATDAVRQGNSIASSAYSVANNYLPFIDAGAEGVLVLSPVNCRPMNVSFVDCQLGGTVAINVTIVAAHSGIFDVRGEVYGIGPFSQKASYSVGEGPATVVQVGNATITLSPPLKTLGPLHEIVQGGRPKKETVHLQLAGLDVKMPAASLGQTISGSCAVAMVLTYVDVQAQTSYPRTFVIQAQIVLP